MSKVTKENDDLGLSLKEAIGLMPILEQIDLTKILNDQVSGTLRTARQMGLKNFKPTKALIFVIPLDAYMAFPETYHSVIVNSDDEGTSCNSFDAVSIVSFTINVHSGDVDIPIKLSAAISAVASESIEGDKLQDIEKLHLYYEAASNNTNAVIDAYKLVPGKHNHTLQGVTLLSSPGHINSVLYDIESKNIIDKQLIMFHEHPIVDAWNAKPMDEKQMKNFANIHTTLRTSHSMPVWLASKVNDAVDARCLGKDEEGVVLADSYTERTMRFLLFQLLVSNGTKKPDARTRVQNHKKVDDLVDDLGSALGMASGEFKNKVKYSAWKTSCRNRRNNLNHELMPTSISPTQSFHALDKSLQMIKKMCEEINRKYPNAVRDTQWLIYVCDFTDSVKKGEKLRKKQKGPINKSDSPFNPQIDYEELSNSTGG